MFKKILSMFLATLMLVSACALLSSCNGKGNGANGLTESPMPEAELKDAVSAAVSRIDPNYFAVITIDRA